MRKLVSATTLLFAVFTFLFSFTEAYAQSREFKNPHIRGVRLDFCKHQGLRGCGQPAADLFCKEVNYSRSVFHVMDPRTGEAIGRTLIFGDGALCQGIQCRAFASITCLRDEVFKTPTPNQPKPPKKQQPKEPEQKAEPKPKKKAEPKPKKKAEKPKKKKKYSDLPSKVPLPKPRPETETAQTGETEPADNFVLIPMKVNKFLPAGATLTYCPGNYTTCDYPNTNPLGIEMNNPPAAKNFLWSINNVPDAKVALWQVSSKPFPAFTNTDQDINFDGLLKWSVIADPGKNEGHVLIGLGDIVKEKNLTEIPEYFYVRIIPMSGLIGGKAVGQPSNTMVIRTDTETPAPPDIDLSDLQEDLDTYVDPKSEPLFRFRVKSFRPPDFDKGNKWGCVVVIEHPETWNITDGFLGQMNKKLKADYPIGEEICPKPYRGDSGKIDSFGDFVDFVFDAWDWVGDRYDDLVEIAADIVLYTTPQGLQCVAGVELVGEDALDDLCETGARAAVNAGMVALGIPPTLPSYNELIDKGVDYAVEVAVDEFERKTGVPCVGPCEDAFRAGIEEMAENLKRQPDRTACVDTKEARKHGRERMCLPDGLLVRPAPGTQYELPVAEIEIIRRTDVDLPWGKPHPDCHAFASLNFKNFFPGGRVYGATPAQSTEVDAQPIEGKLFGNWNRILNQSMLPGESITVVAMFTPATKHQFPWTKELWKTSQIVQRDELGPYGPDWFQLFLQSQMVMTVGSNCAENATEFQMTMPDW